MTEMIPDAPIPVPCAECIAKVHADAWLEREHQMLELGEHANSIRVEAKRYDDSYTWTTLGGLCDGVTWTAEEPPVVLFRALGRLQLLMDEGLTLAALRDKYRWCLPCAENRSRECSSCRWCEEHGCDESCEDAKLGRYYESVDAAYDGYREEL